jgi:hypothetical protein
LNARASTEKKSDDSKDSFFIGIRTGFDRIRKYRMKILLGDFNEKLGREDIFKPTIENESLHQDSTDNGVRIINVAASKTLVVKSTIFPHRSIHKYICTCPDGKTHNQLIAY